MTIKYLFAAVLGLALAGCGGGGGGSETMVVADDTTLAASPTTTAAVKDESFVFASGVPALGTSGSTTLKFTDASATPAFSIAADGYTATGTTAFGSCIFKVTNSTFPAAHPLANGKTLTVNPCSVRVNTAGVTANGETTSRSVALLLGAANSAGVSVTVGITATGGLALNGSVVAMVTLTPITGAT